MAVLFGILVALPLGDDFFDDWGFAVGPTAWSGWAEWTTTGPREKRVGLVHAVTATADAWAGASACARSHA